MPPARLRAEERGEERDVLAPLGERRDADREHLQAVEEVLAERPSATACCRSVLVAANEPHVRAQRPRAAERVVLLRVQEVEELRLRGGVNSSPISSRKSVPRSALSTLPSMRRVAVECAPGSAPKSSLSMRRLGQRGAVERDEGCAARARCRG